MNESKSAVRANKPRRRRRGLPRLHNGARARATAASAILMVWGISVVWDIYSKTYDPPEGINTVALAAATYLFGSAFFRDKNGVDH